MDMGAWIVFATGADSKAAKNAARAMVGLYASSMPAEQLERNDVDPASSMYEERYDLFGFPSALTQLSARYAVQAVGRGRALGKDRAPMLDRVSGARGGDELGLGGTAVPVMDGEFLCEDTVGIVKGVGGGNLLILAASKQAALAATDYAGMAAAVVVVSVVVGAVVVVVAAAALALFYAALGVAVAGLILIGPIDWLVLHRTRRRCRGIVRAVQHAGLRELHGDWTRRPGGLSRRWKRAGDAPWHRWRVRKWRNRSLAWTRDQRAPQPAASPRREGDDGHGRAPGSAGGR